MRSGTEEKGVMVYENWSHYLEYEKWEENRGERKYLRPYFVSLSILENHTLREVKEWFSEKRNCDIEKIYLMSYTFTDWDEGVQNRIPHKYLYRCELEGV